MKNAVVFDVAGTLIKRCRVVKNLKINKIEDGTNTLEIVNDFSDTAIVVLQIDTKTCLMNANENIKLYDFIKKYDVNIDISYSVSKINKEDVLNGLKQSNILIKEFQDVARELNNKNKAIEICSGSAFIFDKSKNKITHIIAAGGKIFPNVYNVVETLKEDDIPSFIASGDRSESLYEIGKILNIPKENIYLTANTERKQEIIKELKEKYDKVMMVGNGPNDVLAFNESDVSVLTLQQNEYISDELKSKVDHIINDIIEVLDIEFYNYHH
jgi:Cu+-exporting ATPase